MMQFWSPAVHVLLPMHVVRLIYWWLFAPISHSSFAPRGDARVQNNAARQKTEWRADSCTSDAARAAHTSRSFASDRCSLFSFRLESCLVSIEYFIYELRLLLLLPAFYPSLVEFLLQSSALLSGR